jgi:hypothetical protein
MHNMLLGDTKIEFVAITFIGIFANEMTIINNSWWLSIQLYKV